MTNSKRPINALYITVIAFGILSVFGLANYSFAIFSNEVSSVGNLETPSREFTILPTIELSNTPFQVVTSTYTSTPTRTKTPTPTPSQTPSSTPTPIPTITPTHTATIPVQAMIKEIYGFGQLLPLSCEARSSADWARYFGFEIREMDFMARLPRSQDPDLGFVGDPYGGWGQIPPNPYGVHAPPIAQTLRSYGLKAEARRNLSWEDLKDQITANKPVIVWVTGHVEPGKGVQIEIDGVTRTVARYEHTVILIGYDPQYVTILDGKQIYQRSIEVFLKSWAALENMAVVWNEEIHITENTSSQ